MYDFRIHWTYTTTIQNQPILVLSEKRIPYQWGWSLCQWLHVCCCCFRFHYCTVLQVLGTQEFSDNCQDMPKHSEPKTEPVLNFVQPFHVDEVIRYLTHSIRGKRLISIIRYKWSLWWYLSTLKLNNWSKHHTVNRNVCSEIKLIQIPEFMMHKYSTKSTPLNVLYCLRIAPRIICYSQDLKRDAGYMPMFTVHSNKWSTTLLPVPVPCRRA